ncbi:hypothetical protein EHS13_18365 [Paenibacillus psychroresistens]|uniref:Uncharacterized protein n=1 Tax=Paenibacillus psychroresistens TaxID=1778678 RepID=A0A6B8RLS1_9BACL|nr:hypothetical protein [Paenibacillus psychroresistens]QGQ96704.1 hypothetical protein EHS13_18365 [Paenibacillus psychroresistens]
MSRKWERMVLKNKKITNKQRTKQGKEVISRVYKEPMLKFFGRSWFLPLLCIGFSLFFTLSYPTSGQDATTKFVIIAYFVMGLFIYFVRRPRLSVGKTTLSSRRFSRDVTLEAAEIDGITVQKAYVIIHFRQKKSRWVFSKLMHRFDIRAMSTAVEEFANNNGILFIDQTKGV